MVRHLKEAGAILMGKTNTPELTLSFETVNVTYNMTGWPGAVVRGGASPEGLPIGVQVLAAPSREDQALAVAKLLEDELGGFRPVER